MKDEFTLRNAAKTVVKAAIAYKTGKMTKNAIADHTEYDKDAFVPDTIGMLVGWYISSKFEPVTDKIVDKTADQINVLKTKLQEKKAAEETK
ncbi:MAG TPA: hypothetical protein VN843_23330 [Anaerolineales bacterium]|nr:hypothetical protein [Anaerolineales bacterium]